MAGKSTGLDLVFPEAQAHLIEREFVARPLPEVESQLKLWNLKQTQCGILTLSFPDCNPIDDPLAYAALFNNLATVNKWVVTGEYNADGIFHTHALFQTPVRSDSLRRSLCTEWDRISKHNDSFRMCYGQACQCDCLKLQRTVKPESMMSYMMKQPMWVMSDDESILQLMYDLDEHGYPERFRTAKDVSPEMNQMTKELIEIIQEHNCKTFQDIIKANPEIVSKYIHRPGLNAIINNCIEFVRATGNIWKLEMYSKYDPDPETIHKCLLHQGILPSDFDPTFYKWITKSDAKKNTLMLIGPSDSGKSSFIKGLKHIMSWGEIVNGDNGFNFEGLIDQPLGIWEEPLIGPPLAEKCKQVFEGMPCAISVKYKKPHMLNRIPILITTNHELHRFCSAEKQTFDNRIYRFEFKYNARDTNYICRASEHSCQCRICQASSHRQTSIGGTGSCGVQRANEPVPTGSQSLWAAEISNVVSGPMLGGITRDGRSDSTSGGNDQASCSSPITSEPTADTTRPSGSSSPGNEFNIRRGGYDGSSNTQLGMGSTGSEPTEFLESRCDTQHHGSDNVRMPITTRIGQSRQFGDGGTGISEKKHTTTKQMVVLGKTKAKKKTLSLHSKKRRMDREMDTEMTLVPLQVPIPDDWRTYLAYLWCKYADINVQ